MAAVVYLSPIGNGTQYLSSANILALANGGTINTYAAGTTTPQATYTTSAGTVQNATSIAIGPSGTPATQIWLDITLGYKFIILDALSNQIGPTFDNITPQTAVTLAYTAPFTGAIASTTATKLGVVRSVFDFMTVAQIADAQSYSPALDATASIQAAITSLPASGGTIDFPPAGYLISSVTVNKQCWLRGSGQFSFGTLIIPKNANSNVFDFTSSSITLTDMCFDFGPTQTGGSFIKFDTASSICHVERVQMYGWWVGIYMNGISSFTAKHIHMEGGVAGSGTAVLVLSGVNMLLQDITVTNSSGARPLAGLNVQACGDLSIEYCQFIQCIDGCLVNPGAGQVVTSLRAVNSFFDNSGSYGLLVQPTSATGSAIRSQFIQCWFSSAGITGIQLDAATNSSTIDGFEFTAPEVYLNTSHGVNISKAINTKFIGGKVAGNGGQGIVIGANTSNIDIIGMTIGPVSAITFNTGNAINILAGTTNNLLIQSNDLRNTGGGGVISDSSTGTNRRKVDNRGFNPAGTTSISVTASPFTYTAGDTPETVYVNTGTVSLITVEAIGVYSETNVTVRLGPGKAMVVTYSSLPGMATTKD